MAREIKFRAWDKKHNRWLHDESLLDFKGQLCLNECMTLEGDFELMQYTGLRDRNGVEIYEGDVVTDFVHNPAIVKFGNYMAGGNDYYASGAYGFYIQRLFNGEVINEDDTETLNGHCTILGNVYQNPELLK